jgi:hypothetical protein
LPPVADGTVSETGTVCVTLFATNVRVPLYCPAASPETFAVTSRLAGATPLVKAEPPDVTVSQFPPLCVEGVTLNDVLEVKLVTARGAQRLLGELSEIEVGTNVRYPLVVGLLTVTMTGICSGVAFGA